MLYDRTRAQVVYGFSRHGGYQTRPHPTEEQPYVSRIILISAYVIPPKMRAKRIINLHGPGRLATPRPSATQAANTTTRINQTRNTFRLPVNWLIAEDLLPVDVLRCRGDAGCPQLPYRSADASRRPNAGLSPTAPRCTRKQFLTATSRRSRMWRTWCGIGRSTLRWTMTPASGA